MTIGSTVNDEQLDAADSDQVFLRRRDRPQYEVGDQAVAVADLFCGLGGMTLGLAEAARQNGRALDVRLAVDLDADAIAVYSDNFPSADVRQRPVEELVDGTVGHPLTESESRLKEEVGELDCLVGGPPCQGHSDLNNHTRRDDPRNGLYARMARAAEVLNPRAIIVENVPNAIHDRGRTVQESQQTLAAAGYSVDHRVIRLVDIGVPQRRRRHTLLAVRDGLDAPEILERVVKSGDNGHRTVRWAIGDLEDWEGRADEFDSAARSSETNRKRIDWLFDNDAYDLPNEHRPPCHRDGSHTYNSMYGRLRWDEPAPTITTGFSSMGQGRFVHPSRRRTLTPHEAARLQFLPDFLNLRVVSRRTAWARMIGNAVPVLLTFRLFDAVLQGWRDTLGDS